MAANLGVEEDPTGPQRPRPSRLLGSFFQHLPALFGVLAVATVVMKLISVSHGDPNTMGALLRSGGAFDLIVATIISGVTSAVGVTVVFTAPNLGEAIREGDSLRAPVANTVLTYILLALVVPAWQLLPAMAWLAWWVISSIIWYRLRRRPPKPVWDDSASSYAVVLAMSAALVWIALIVSDRPWLPAERLTVDGQDLVGFVVEDDESSLVVLRERDRGVLRVSASAVSDREFCSVHGRDARTALNLLLGHARAEYPACNPKDES